MRPASGQSRHYDRAAMTSGLPRLETLSESISMFQRYQIRNKCARASLQCTISRPPGACGIPGDRGGADPTEGAEAMFNLSRSTGLCVLLACSGFLLSSQAQAFDLTGAWATGADQCNKIFVKKGDQISFAQYSEEFGRGFVADGNEIRSKTTRCTIKSRKEEGDTIDFHAAGPS